MDPAPALEPAPDCAKAVPAKPSASTDVVNNKRFITIQPPWSAALICIGAFYCGQRRALRSVPSDS
jgi:hypothetical protein